MMAHRSSRSVGVCSVASALLVAAGQASAQCPSTNGPDVIVGDLNGITNYSSAAGVEALSLGTTSCNIGREALRWFDGSSNMHPVIGGALYRMKTENGYTRFEHVGQSWLKHGFCALRENLCCNTCVPFGPFCDYLGSGCSDPYTSDRNGSQGGLGPRWQVNADTGVFPFPPANPSFSGQTARRLQVAITDLEVANNGTPAVRYYGEAMYVASDDAAANNGNNNASYRRVNVARTNDTTWNFSFNGVTQRQQAALRAWKDVDPTVTETDIQIPDEGFFIVSSQATDLGGGQWHYEFAVYNMNSHRSAGTFSVPVADGVTVTNIGFHDVDYRNGDGEGNANRSGADWTSNHSGGILTWATETQAQNNNANAIRWASTYNFRFDADVAPVDGDVTIGLWRPGTPSSVGGLARIPGIPGPGCAPDWNGDEVVTSDDYFAFLEDFFAGDADFNDDGATTSDDFFAFLDAFFKGC